MNDTPPHIAQKQFEIFMSKPVSERIRMAFEMMEFGRMMVEKQILRKNPNISFPDLRKEVFKKMYAEDFSPEELEKIGEGIRVFHFKKMTNATTRNQK